MPAVTRATDHKLGNAIVRRAIRHGLVPEFKNGVSLVEQTTETRWVLHVLAVMSKDGKADIQLVKNILEKTKNVFGATTSEPIEGTTP
tara:strand:+ start:2659 stop:2922 length:264 start_codon:yes stop_codon:yes gene_type:complete